MNYVTLAGNLDIALALTERPDQAELWSLVEDKVYAPEHQLTSSEKDSDTAELDTVLDLFWYHDLVTRLLQDLLARLDANPNTIFRFYQPWHEMCERQDPLWLGLYFNSAIELFRQAGNTDISDVTAPKLIFGLESRYVALVAPEYKEEIINGVKTQVVGIYLWDYALC